MSQTEQNPEEVKLWLQKRGKKINDWTTFAYISSDGSVHKANQFGNFLFAPLQKDSSLVEVITQAIYNNFEPATQEDMELIKGSALSEIIQKDQELLRNMENDLEL